MAAPKTIKGITIEIAGDTKKLGAALKNIDEQSQDLAANLKYVDKLLDFDPGNTELLAEKQKLLADAVENTGERLEALKEVQDQVARQYQTGEIGQRAYLDFQHELAKTERKLEGLRSESQKVERSLDDTGDEARDTSKDFGNLKVGADDAAGGMGSLDDSLGSLIKGGKIAAVAGLFVGAVRKIGEIADETREYQEEMAKLDISFESAKLSAEDADIAYSKLYRVLGETDQSVEAAQQLARIADSTQSVARWAAVALGLVARFGDALQPETFYESAVETYNLKEATGAFVQLLEGTAVYSVEEYEKKLASLKDKEERLAYQQMGPGAIAVDQFNTKLQSLTTEAERQAYMLEVVESLLGDAAAAYEERNAQVLEARDADRKWTESIGKVGEALRPLSTDLKNFGADIVERLAPHVETVVQILYDMRDAFSETGQQVAEEWPEMVDTAVGYVGKWGEILKGWSDSVSEFFGDAADVVADANQTVGQDTAAMTTIVETLSNDMSLAAYGVYDPWIGAGATVADVCNGMAQSYTEVISKIQKQEWSLPKPKVPIFGIRGKFSLNPPSVPELNISWNAKGGIFASPMVLPAMDGSLQGFGEAGQEAILPLNSLYENLERIVARKSGPQSIVFEPHLTVYQQAGEDGEAVAQRAAELMMDKFYQEVGGLG